MWVRVPGLVLFARNRVRMLDAGCRMPGARCQFPCVAMREGCDFIAHCRDQGGHQDAQKQIKSSE